MLNGLLDDITACPHGLPRGRQWRRIVVFSLLIVSPWLLPGGVGADERDRPIRIGVLTPSWGPPPQVIGLRDGLLELGYSEDARELGITFPLVVDSDGEIRRAYGVIGLPTTFLIGRDGRTVGLAVRPRVWSSVPARAIIQVLLKESVGKKVAP